MREAYRVRTHDLTEELALIERAQQGDVYAEEDLLRKYTGMIRSIARRRWPHRDDLDDLFQEGAIALVQAIKRFDLRRGSGSNPRAYFAKSVNFGIIEWIQEQMSTGFSSNEREQWQRVSQLIGMLREKLGREPSYQEVAAEFGVEVERIVDLVPPKIVEYSLAVDEAGDVDPARRTDHVGWDDEQTINIVSSASDAAGPRTGITDVETLARFHDWRAACLGLIEDPMQRGLFLLRQGRLFEPGGPLTMEEAARRLRIKVVDDARVLEAVTLDLLEDRGLILFGEEPM